MSTSSVPCRNSILSDGLSTVDILPILAGTGGLSMLGIKHRVLINLIGGKWHEIGSWGRQSCLQPPFRRLFRSSRSVRALNGPAESRLLGFGHTGMQLANPVGQTLDGLAELGDVTASSRGALWARLGKWIPDRKSVVEGKSVDL